MQLLILFQIFCIPLLNYLVVAIRVLRKIWLLLIDYYHTSHLHLTHGHSASLFASVDSSYDCYSDSKSHSGISLHLGQYSGTFLSMSKKQTITAELPTVAEFMATYSACQKILLTQNFITELNFISSVPTVLFQYNMSTIRVILHKGNAGRTKHIALRYI